MCLHMEKQPHIIKKMIFMHSCHIILYKCAKINSKYYSVLVCLLTIDNRGLIWAPTDLYNVNHTDTWTDQTSSVGKIFQSTI